MKVIKNSNKLVIFDILRITLSVSFPLKYQPSFILLGNISVRGNEIRLHHYLQYLKREKLSLEQVI